MMVRIKEGCVYFIFGKLHTDKDGWFDLQGHPFSESTMECEEEDQPTEKPRRGRKPKA